MPDRNVLVWINGELRRPGEAGVSPFDHGLVVGDGAFETLKIVDRTPFAITRHVRRMHSTLAALAVEPPSADDLRRALTEVVAANDVASGRVRLTVTAGLGPLGSGTPTGPVTVIAAVDDAAFAPPPTAIVAPWTRNESGALTGLKTTSYAENVRALRFAHDQGCGEAIFANTRGDLCEGTGTNVFVAVEGELITPPLSSGCLGGITRELLIELLDVSETPVPIEILEAAQEVFLTSSTRDVQPLSRVNERRLAGPGPLGTAAMESFGRLVAADLDP